MEFYASCPTGFEAALAAELKRLDAPRVRPLKGRVGFEGDPAHAYRVCLWSRLASRVFLVLGRAAAQTADELYEAARNVAWEEVLAEGATFAVTARGTTPELRNTHFSALRVKDAVCDRLAEKRGGRPDVDPQHADARIGVSLARGRVSFSLDLSGDPLFKRLPREAARPGAAAVLRPDYAALALELAGWPAACAIEEQPVLVDLACAGGGIELEAAACALDRAPGIARARWGFEGWAQHDQAAWNALLDEADARAEAAENRTPRILATDIDADASAFAQRIVRAGGVGNYVTFTGGDTAELIALAGMRADGAEPHPGAIVLDMSAVTPAQLPLVLARAAALRRAPACARMPLACIAEQDVLSPALGVEPSRNVEIKPQQRDLRLIVYPAANAPAEEAPASASEPVAAKPASPDKRKPAADAADAGADDAPAANALHTEQPAASVVDLGDKGTVPVLVPESEQFAARLKKVARLRRKWAKREHVSCYRVYDADLPDYAAAIDLYTGTDETPGRWLVIAEYQAPKTIDPAKAQARMLDILALAPKILDVAPENVFAKTRQRAKGGSQYAQDPRAAKADKRPPVLVQEGGLTFEVNFDAHLDTGIFLDHRVTRAIVRERAAGVHRFLNLFAYTGTASVYAADGGAKETVTVDLSNTYLAWAQRNMALNGFTGPEDTFVRADVLSWINEQRHSANRWDLIFCDPPTFSNSASMSQRSFEIQRDHAELLIGVTRLLTRGGMAIFSCNLRRFKPDLEKLARAGVVLEDITAETIPEDFARNPRIHHCYLVRRTTPAQAMRFLEESL